MAKPSCVLFLLDWRPVFWSTREEYYRQLCRALSGRGIVPILTVSEPVEVEVARRLEDAGAHVVALSYHARPGAYWSHLRRVAKGYNVRIAHVRFFDYFTALFWLCRSIGIHAIFFTESNSGEWNSRGWRASLIRLRTKVMCGPLTKAIAISGFVRQRLTSVGIPTERTGVIHNGADLTQYHPETSTREGTRARMGADSECVVLIYASTLLAFKRPDVALRACAALVARGTNVQLWIAGEGPLRGGLEALARELGIDRHVRWLGHQRDLAAWYSGADVFLHTAVGEAFGNVLVEAMACGLPVVATASGAAPELVVDGVTGRLVSPGTREIEDLADAALSILADQKRHADMKKAAVLQARRFPIEESVAKTLEAYAPFLNG